MGVTISWTKLWSASDDGTILGGADLGDIQAAIDAHSHTSGLDTLTNMADTPNSYVGEGLKVLRVNSGASAIEFFTPTMTRTIMWYVPYPEVTDDASAKILLPFAATSVTVTASVNTAPSGGPCTIQIQDDGTDVITTPLSITDGNTTVNTTTFDVSSIAADSVLTLDVDAVNDAEGLTVMFEVTTGLL